MTVEQQHPRISLSKHHSAVVLFYRYFDDAEKVQQVDAPRIQAFCKALCCRLGLKGRILVATEGINGTISAQNCALLDEFIDSMEGFETEHKDGCKQIQLFRGIDWKISTTTEKLEPFPDLKISIVKEIISTGGTISVQDVKRFGATHLSPKQFHETIRENPDCVMVDVRNTFEHAIGHFVNPSTMSPAVNPETTTFCSFDKLFCQANAHQLKDKTVMMYCTGGIRCEKASVMLKRKGIDKVFQLKGGIHRYIEQYGEDGFFKGKNFVFDQRVAQTPAECKASEWAEGYTIVGKCTECGGPYDELCGSRLCTVCRDLVLVCDCCRQRLREYHCARHALWKSCYFTFLEVFDKDELLVHKQELSRLRDQIPSSREKRNIRRTLARQIQKVQARIELFHQGVVTADKHAPRRCRTCMETADICDGKCWGFWKTNHEAAADAVPIAKIDVGVTVEPGPDWNELRLGPRRYEGMALRGTVVELKTWGAGGTDNDCAMVQWEHRDEPLIYRWGVVAVSGKRLYDLQVVSLHVSSGSSIY